MDPSEPHWRTNSSYSPYLSRRWDCSSQSDELSNRVLEAPLTGSSLSLHSKSGRQTGNNDPIHHHSVSDGALSYSESPSDYLPARRWISCVHRYDLGEFFTPSGGARPEAAFFSRGSEGCVSVANGIGSPFSPLESSRWASTSKQPRHLSNRRSSARPEAAFFSKGSEGCVSVANGIGSPFSPLESSRWASTSKQPRHLSNRRSFMSKPIYPLMFQNPVSDSDIPGMAEASTSGARMHHEDSGASPMWAERTSSTELKFHRALNELRKMEASPDLSMSLVKEGLRWSNSSSYDFRFDGDAVDITEAMDIEKQRCPSNTTRYQRCELCKRLLRQKSPWSSNRIVRSTDMPVTGILPCHHVFHADCLEETTPKSQIHEPPCPVCLKSLGQEKQISFSEHAHVAFKSASSKGQGARVSSGLGTSRTLHPHQVEDDMRRNSSLAEPHHRSSSMKNHIKKRFSFKGKIGKDLLGAKMFSTGN